ncbi:MAG TPA: cytochrome C oxidase subunit IV family protein [Candidatus Saccharimonadales bacterium]|nr:cytochrome C oxidase subunit IV family protein [Candidatus Saccharimonadales bacterium]
MSDLKLSAREQDSGKKVLTLYIFGFAWSLLLTLTAYFWTTRHIMTTSWLMYALCGLAIGQCAAQLYFFLHVAAGTRPRWKFISFWFMLLIVLIVVVGSLWIMHSLNTRMMSPSAMDDYMQSQVGL